MTDVLIHSPYSLDGHQGNAISALRLIGILEENAMSVAVEAGRSRIEKKTRCLIALNAMRSAQAIGRFHVDFPGCPVVVLLTGTDINHPDAGKEGSPTWKSLETADRLVLLHDASMAVVPEKFHAKCSVIYPSVTLPDGLKHAPEGEGFDIVMAGNMREEKNPELAVRAAARLPAGMRLHVYGDFSAPDLERLTRHGAVPHGEMLAAMSRARVLLNTSHQEGGANAICEAVSMGLPVIATAIPGNIGMLGADYAGLFPPDDAEALGDLLGKTASDPAFYALLKEQVTARAPLFKYGRESEAWVSLLNTLIK